MATQCPRHGEQLGYVYDKTKVTRPMETWQDFFDAAVDEASGQTSMLADPNEVIGAYFWANDEDWNTTDTAALDACEEYLIDNISPHVKAFESYPGTNGIPQGSYYLCQAWNGDGRQGIIDSGQRQLGVGVPITT